MHPIVPLMMFLSVLFPDRAWTPVNQPVNVQVHSATDVSLRLTDMDGKVIEPPSGPDSINVTPGSTVDVRKMYLPSFSQTGTFILFAVPKGQMVADYLGTPLVVEIRQNIGPDAMPGPTVIHIEPLVYAAMDTDQGPMAMMFYFDSAPNTVDNFQRLAMSQFYDGLTFHRIVPGFIIQGGDPRGDGTGGPGYSINAELSNRLHLPGAVSMARETDPAERDGAAPRPEYVNSAGSQFFISIDHAKTKELDYHYTVFGTIVRGMETVNKIAGLPLTGPQQSAPKNPPMIKTIQIKPVTPTDDPYATMLHLPEPKAPATEPATSEATTESATEPTTIPGPRPTTANAPQ